MFKPSFPCLSLTLLGGLIGLSAVEAAHLPAVPSGTTSSHHNRVSKNRGSAWQDLWSKKPPVETPPRGSRGNLCAIAPVPIKGTAQIWNQRPVLIWRGAVGRVEIHWEQQDQRWQKQVLGPQRLLEQVDWVVYTGPPLLPGPGYYWLILDAQSRPVARLPFQVLGSDRTVIAADLQQLEQRLKGQKASVEEIAQRRAHYFADRQLWTDVLQEALSVPDPSPALTQFLLAIPEQFCQAKRTP